MNITDIKDISVRSEEMKYPNKEKVVDSINGIINMAEKGFKMTSTAIINLNTIKEYIIKFYPESLSESDANIDEDFEKRMNVSINECTNEEISDMENVFGSQAAYCACVCLYNKCINRAATSDDKEDRDMYRKLSKWYMQKANELMEKVDARIIKGE